MLCLLFLWHRTLPTDSGGWGVLRIDPLVSASQAINAALRGVPAWPLYMVAPVPAAWWLYLGLTGGLGVDPIEGLEHALGEFALQLVIAVLAVTPLRILTGVSLLKFRRALGLIAFFYVALHLLVWLFLDVRIWAQIWADILKRPYITIGMAAFVLMIPLAVTSNNLSIRKLGPVAWRKLHRLMYPAALLGGMHYVMLAKTWQVEPVVYLTMIVGLLCLRLIPRTRRARA